MPIKSQLWCNFPYSYVFSARTSFFTLFFWLMFLAHGLSLARSWRRREIVRGTGGGTTRSLCTYAVCVCNASGSRC
ncbi:hypothetical protein F5Y11DRAFT_320111 [Daldinia sp. FL1419]|nr:hypothetical protein F5Y11DRAFT_320111 [Daldinia sp. FL1419]